MSKKKTAIVVGTGAGGGVIASALQGEYQVIILEVGKEFKPFSLPIDKMAGLRRTGLFLYVADATILPEAMGNPPILTIMALAKKIAAVIQGGV